MYIIFGILGVWDGEGRFVLMVVDGGFVWEIVVEWGVCRGINFLWFGGGFFLIGIRF